MRFIIVSAITLALAGCDDGGFKRHREAQQALRDAQWQGARVARICHDGTRIYRLKNDALASGWNERYDATDPKDICG